MKAKREEKKRKKLISFGFHFSLQMGLKLICIIEGTDSSGKRKGKGKKEKRKKGKRKKGNLESNQEN